MNKLKPAVTGKIYHDQVGYIQGIQSCFTLENHLMLFTTLVDLEKK